MRLNLKLPQATEVAQRLGIDKNGQAQKWHTQNVLRRMQKYMPMQTGMFASKQTLATSATTITTTAPQAYYLYYGVKMVNAKTGKGARYIKGIGFRYPRGATLIPTTEPLEYTKTFHKEAGAFWDKRLVAQEGNIIANELEKYIKSRG